MNNNIDNNNTNNSLNSDTNNNNSNNNFNSNSNSNNNNNIDFLPIKKISTDDNKIETNNKESETSINQNSQLSNNSNKDSLKEEEKNETLETGLLVILIIKIITIVLEIKDGIKLDLILDLYFALIIYLGYKKAKEKKTIAVKYGIAIGIILLLSGTILNAIFGIFTLYDAINYNRKLKNVEKPKKEWLTVLYILIIYIALILIIILISIGVIFNSKLKCTRNNGYSLNVEYRFNKDGNQMLL